MPPESNSRQSPDAAAARGGAMLPDGPIDGRYELVDQIGVGGMGHVYSARDLAVGGRACAVKILSAAADNEVARQRFAREVRLISALNSPHIVAVDDSGHLPDGRPYLVMELLKGRTLKTEISRAGRLRPEVAVRVVDDLLAGLAVAHAAGVVHRDVKPGNVFLCDAGGEPPRASLLDFGLARPQLAEEDAGLTSQNLMVGSPPYMSPEQITQGELDGRSDIYALGITFHIMLAGRHPFDLDAVPEKLRGLSRRTRFVWCHLYQNIKLVDGVSDELRQVVGRFHATRPQYRYQTATDAMRALRRTPEGAHLGPIDPAVDEAVPATIPVRIADLDLDGIVEDAESRRVMVARPSDVPTRIDPTGPGPIGEEDEPAMPPLLLGLAAALAVVALGGVAYWLVR